MRRGLLPTLLALLAGISVMAGSPNVVLVSLDTFRADRLAAFGGDASICPELNALAARGAVFTRCVTPVPVTLPAHATLLTGCFPSRTGLHDNGSGSLAKDLPTLAGAFKAAGYASRAIVASSVLDDRYGLARGFDYYDDGVGRDMRRSATEVTDRALEAYRGRKGPVFLWVHYFDTHEPYASPEEFLAKRPRSLYDAAAAYLDSEVGRLLKGLGPDTLIAVVSDHGEGLGDHREQTHGVLLFQPTMAVPLILVGPGLPSGKRSEVNCSLADVAPTLLKSAGLAVAGKPDGADLGPAVFGKHFPARPVPLETWLPYGQFRWLPLSGVTDGRWKWIRGRTLHLYDLQADPGEKVDLATKAPPAASALKAFLPAAAKAAPVSDKVDSSLRGLGYAPVPSSGGSLKGLPDPHDRVDLLAKLDEARALRAKEDFGPAVARFKEVTAADAGNPTAWFELGEALRRQGDLAGASAALDRALALVPKMPESLTSRGMVSLAQGKEDSAAAFFKKALASDPTMILALNPLAAYHLGRNRPAEALPLLDRAIHQGFANADTYLLQMRVHLVQGQWEAAERDFREAMHLSADPPSTLKAAADIFIIKEMFPQGIQLYEEGIRRFPDYPFNYLTLGGILLQAEQPEKALPLYRRALDLDLSPQDRQNVREIVDEMEAALAAGEP